MGHHACMRRRLHSQLHTNLQGQCMCMRVCICMCMRIRLRGYQRYGCNQGCTPQSRRVCNVATCTSGCPSPGVCQALQRGLCDMYVLPCAMTMVPAWPYWIQHNQLCLHVQQRFNAAFALSRPWHYYHCHSMSAQRLRAAILKTSHACLIPRIVFLTLRSTLVLPCPSRPLRNCC